MVPFLSFPKGSAELAMASSQTILNIRERPIPVFAVSESVCVCVCVHVRSFLHLQREEKVLVPFS